MPMEVLVMTGKGRSGIHRVAGRCDAGKCQNCCQLCAEAWQSSMTFRKISIPKCDLHIHAPEGAVPKDGPSAGVTMATAIDFSALSGRPVRGDVAMTGEITLHGKVLPIGGLREKSMAAYKAGIRTVIIPEDNIPDLEEIDETVRSSCPFHSGKNAGYSAAKLHWLRPTTAEKCTRDSRQQKLCHV